MSFAQILARLESMNAEISLFRSNYLYAADERWTATIHIDHKEKQLELKARAVGQDVEDALQAAWRKVEAIINSHSFAQGFEIPLLTIEGAVAPEREVTF
jgi:hypothetical protein